MKKILFLFLIINSSVANAQVESESISLKYVMEKYSAMFSVFFMVFMVASFIIVFTRLILDTWLKNKMIDKGVSETFFTQFTQTNRRNLRQDALKWALIFAGLSTGLLLISIVYPLRDYSLPVITLCLAISFYVYFKLLKNIL